MSWIFDRFRMPSLIEAVADRAFVQWSKRRAARLDAMRISDVQVRTLLALVRKGAATRFGRDYRFDTIQSIDDYRRRVPLRSYEQLWREYLEPSFPSIENVLWRGAPAYFALSSGTTSAPTKHIPISKEMLASNNKAALTSVAWFRAHRPGASLLTGRTLFLGGSTDLAPLPGGVKAGDLSGIAANETSLFLQPFVFPPKGLAIERDWDRKLEAIAVRSTRLNITAITGVPSWLLVLFRRVLEIAGKRTLIEVWPALRLIVHGGVSFAPYRELMVRLAGSDQISFLETYPSSEGFVAAEDPRFGALRLIPDHGVFFEFVPTSELEHSKPTRHAIADVIPGVQYAVVLTTCAGLWSYLLGDTVCFESRDPPLLRVTGRIKQFLSAFGEHLINEEVERAIADAATHVRASVIDFHVGPEFSHDPAVAGRHRYFVEFENPPVDLDRFATELDVRLRQLNDDYAAHRAGDLTLRLPAVTLMPKNGFRDWMRERGKLGGQNKTPRMDNTGRIGEGLKRWLARREPYSVGIGYERASETALSR